MALHVAHWKITGKTLAPLELNEVMYTFELGIVTAGFLFMAVVFLATLIFGRFFCSWGCHILALQDLCAWVLEKFRIRPKPIRSRAMMWIPIVTALYMFVWPQVVRISEGRARPQLHFRTDAQGWASLTTENFWRNLPSPGVTALTFAVCGFLIVYVLGSRAFCIYGCPYGAAFRLADRLAPGKIRLKTQTDCLKCGACTAACGSHVRVHEELNRFGMVVNSACLKDLDCVAACPQGNVTFGFGRPALLKKVVNDTPVRKQVDFTVSEEVVLILVFLSVLITCRGLYDRIPLFLSMALGIIVAWLFVLFIRLVRRPDMQWNRWWLKSGGRLRSSGWTFVVFMFALTTFAVHCGVIRYHSFQGRRYAQQARITATDQIVTKAIDHLASAEHWGLLSTPHDVTLLADLYYQLAGIRFSAGRLQESETHLRAALQAHPQMTMAHYDLGALLIQKGDLASGVDHLKRVVAAKPDFAEGHYNLALGHWMSGANNDARREIDAAYQLNPTDVHTRELHDLMHENHRP